MTFDDPYFEEFELPPEGDDDELEPLGPWWRRPLLIGVAALTAAAMLLVPIYNVIQGQPLADNGLEVCGFDYCVVQDSAIAAGLNEEMSRLANTFLSDSEATQLAEALLGRIGERDVSFVVVDQLEGDIKGQFDPGSRTIFVERPIRAWLVVHEVAHAEASGHGDDFQSALIELTEWLARNRA
jgi:hypothetical protein